VKYPKDFKLYVERERIEVRFVSAKKLGRMDTKAAHATGGTYRDCVIKLPRYEYLGTQRAALLHELAHHLFHRQELDRSRGWNEEDACDLLTWLPGIYGDKRNKRFRKFMLGSVPW
jgi:hypothetical protein